MAKIDKKLFNVTNKLTVSEGMQNEAMEAHLLNKCGCRFFVISTKND